MFRGRLEGSAAVGSSKRGWIFPAGLISVLSGHSLSSGRFVRGLETGAESDSHEWYTELQTLTDPDLLPLNSWACRTPGHFKSLLFFFIIRLDGNKTKRTTQKGVGLFTCKTVKWLQSCHMISTDKDTITVSFENGNETDFDSPASASLLFSRCGF